MIPRRTYRFLVVLTALITIALGLFSVLRSAPSLHWDRDDAVSALRLTDHSAVLAPERRAPRPTVLTPTDPPVAVLMIEIAGLVALLAMATGRFAMADERVPRPGGWFLTWSPRGPPAARRVTLAPAS